MTAQGDIIPTLFTGGITQETGIERVLEIANYSDINRLFSDGLYIGGRDEFKTMYRQE